jgi:hypothetical protein
MFDRDMARLMEMIPVNPRITGGKSMELTNNKLAPIRDTQFISLQ